MLSTGTIFHFNITILFLEIRILLKLKNIKKNVQNKDFNLFHDIVAVIAATAIF